MKRTAIVEGFEGNYCILEIDGQTEDVLKSEVDPAAGPGDVVVWDGVRWIPDPERTEERSKKMKQLMDEVWEDG